MMQQFCGARVRPSRAVAGSGSATTRLVAQSTSHRPTSMATGTDHHHYLLSQSTINIGATTGDGCGISCCNSRGSSSSRNYCRLKNTSPYHGAIHRRSRSRLFPAPSAVPPSNSSPSPHTNPDGNSDDPQTTPTTSTDQPRSRPSIPSPPSSSPPAAAADPTGDPRVAQPATALLLAWFAAGGQSLLAAQCLVEAAVRLYREGRGFGELQLSIKMATHRGTAGAATPSSTHSMVSPLLSPQDEDVLVSWVAIVLLTLQELGVPRDLAHPVSYTHGGGAGDGAPGQPQTAAASLSAAEAEAAAAAAGPASATAAAEGAASQGAAGGGDGMALGSPYLRGMLGYVRQTLGMYDEGQTLARVAGLQGMVAQSAASASPSLALMQQYTRLVLLTLEVAAAARLDTPGRQLRRPDVITRPSGYETAFAPGCDITAPPPAHSAAAPPPPPAGSETAAAAPAPASASAPGAAAETSSPSSSSSPSSLSSSTPAAAGTAGTAVPAADSPGPRSSSSSPCPPRGLAVRLLVAFMGAVRGSDWSLGKFVEGVRLAYEQGLAADELFSQLEEREFAQSGGLLPIADPARTAAAAATAAEAATAAAAAAAATSADRTTSTSADAPAVGTVAGGSGGATVAPQLLPQYEITKQLFSSWISLSYMTLAQLGVPYPAAGQRLGWAWAGFGDPVEAIGMNDFVGNVLRQMAGADPRVIPAASESQAQPQQGLHGPRFRGDTPLVRVEDDRLPATSTAFRVLSQQVALVQAVCQDVMKESHMT